MKLYTSANQLSLSWHAEIYLQATMKQWGAFVFITFFIIIHAVIEVIVPPRVSMKMDKRRGALWGIQATALGLFQRDTRCAVGLPDNMCCAIRWESMRLFWRQVHSVPWVTPSYLLIPLLTPVTEDWPNSVFFLSLSLSLTHSLSLCLSLSRSLLVSPPSLSFFLLPLHASLLVSIQLMSECAHCLQFTMWANGPHFSRLLHTWLTSHWGGNLFLFYGEKYVIFTPQLLCQNNVQQSMKKEEEKTDI